MGNLSRTVWVVLILAVAWHFHQFFLKSSPLPELEEIWWGSRDPSKEDTSIKPFKISVSDQVLKDLGERLSNARPFTPPLQGIQHQYGINTNLLSQIIDFWRTKYNWREREKFFNQFPQFTVSVQGLRLHYLHVKPSNTLGVKIVPLLLLHGWPGSVREFYEILPLLTTPQKGRDFVFEVIAPSLPGYGFSEAAAKPGLGATHMSVVFKNFMKRLGFEKYYVQGGDWGAIIARQLATLYPEHVIGVHSNMCFVNTPYANLKLFLYSFYPSWIVDKKYESRVYPLSSQYAFIMLETGYMHLQATKPDTVGVALNDSPIGLAAYIIEKFITWTNPQWKSRLDGGLTEKFTYTQLLDNIMIYWVTNSITTSMRLYSETFNKNFSVHSFDNIPLTVPSACARSAYDLTYSPTTILKDKYLNLLQITDNDVGHFAAFEAPNLLSADIYVAVEKFEAFHKKNK